MVSNDLDQLLVQYPSLKYNEARTKVPKKQVGVIESNNPALIYR